jgi:hypothetical protein
MNSLVDLAVGGTVGYVLMWFIAVSALVVFAFILRSRIELLLAGEADPRFSNLRQRVKDLIDFGFIQKRQPRYLWAGVIHIMIFWGFMVLGLRSLDLVSEGLGIPIFRPFMESPLGAFYNSLKDFFELIVLVACVWAILRRAIIKPERYEGSHKTEAYVVLGLISFLMVTDMLFEASGMLLTGETKGVVPAAWVAAAVLPEQKPQGPIDYFNGDILAPHTGIFPFLEPAAAFQALSYHYGAAQRLFSKTEKKGRSSPPDTGWMTSSTSRRWGLKK